MEKSELAAILAWVSAVDGRLVNHLTVEAWHEIVGGYNAADVKHVVRAHYTKEARNIYPADIVKLLHVGERLPPELEGLLNR